MKQSLIVVALALLFASPPQAENKPIIYVKHLEQPVRYPPLARQTQVQGTVVVKLKVAADGTVQSAEALTREQDSEASGHPLLRDETLTVVKAWTFGCACCSPTAPYEKTIKFIYRLEGEAISYDNTTVVMDLPDQITITVSPKECDHCPRKKTSHGGNK